MSEMNQAAFAHYLKHEHREPGNAGRPRKDVNAQSSKPHPKPKRRFYADATPVEEDIEEGPRIVKTQRDARWAKRDMTQRDARHAKRRMSEYVAGGTVNKIKSAKKMRKAQSEIMDTINIKLNEIRIRATRRDYLLRHIQNDTIHKLLYAFQEDRVLPDGATKCQACCDASESSVHRENMAPDNISNKQRGRATMQAQAIANVYLRMNRRDEKHVNALEDAGNPCKSSYPGAHGLQTNCEIIDEVALDFNKSGRTVREWMYDFENLGYRGFSEDGRGKQVGNSILLHNDLKLRLRKWMLKQSLKRKLGVTAAQKYINRVLLKDVLDEERKKFRLSKNGICRSTAHSWMLLSGARAGWHKKGFYNDMHERCDVVDYKNNQYLPKCQELELREHLWVHISDADADKLLSSIAAAMNPESVRGLEKLRTELKQQASSPPTPSADESTEKEESMPSLSDGDTSSDDEDYDPGEEEDEEEEEEESESDAPVLAAVEPPAEPAALPPPAPVPTAFAPPAEPPRLSPPAPVPAAVEPPAGPAALPPPGFLSRELAAADG